MGFYERGLPTAAQLAKDGFFGKPERLRSFRLEGKGRPSAHGALADAPSTGPLKDELFGARNFKATHTRH